MRRNVVRRLRSDDDGMTVVEVVVAAAILFFVLTAVLGLVGATTQTSISAKQRTAMTNAVSSDIEFVRSLPFERVAYSDANPAGDVERTVVKTDGAFTITLTNTLATGAHNTRELSVSAVCSAPGYPAMHTTAFAAIRDKLQSVSDLGQPHSGGPLIEFGVNTPDENSVVYESSVEGGGALWVDASVLSTSGVIYAVEFRVGDQTMRSGVPTDSPSAYWKPGKAAANETELSIVWNTLQARDSLGTPAVMDGYRIVRIIATDDLGRRTFLDRRFLVDNFAPSVPGTITAVPHNDVNTLVFWPTAMDGTDPARSYLLQTSKENTTGLWWPEAPPSFVHISTDSLTQSSRTLPTQAFSRYSVRAQSFSPRNRTLGWGAWTTPFVSRPLLTGSSTCVITGSHSTRASSVTVRLACSQPTFGVSAVRYDLYRGTSPSALVLNQSSIPPDTFSQFISQSLGTNGVPTQYYYQVKAYFTPSGWNNGLPNVAQSVLSNVVGPTMKTDGSADMAVAAW